MDPESLEKLSILIVDDNSYMRKIIRTILSGLGIRSVIEAETVDEAFQKMTSDVPSLVITDWAMPGQDGIALIRMLRDEMTSPDPFIPIILLTAYTEKKHIIAAIRAGVNEVLSKPISASALLSRLEAIVFSPRPFIRTETYFGPEPRRHERDELATKRVVPPEVRTLEAKPQPETSNAPDQSNSNILLI
ncbi:MAG: response regulator [Pseudomonadota bacterium]